MSGFIFVNTDEINVAPIVIAVFVVGLHTLLTYYFGWMAALRDAEPYFLRKIQERNEKIEKLKEERDALRWQSVRQSVSPSPEPSPTRAPKLRKSANDDEPQQPIIINGC